MFKIIWSEFAESQLDDIYEYYTIKVSSTFAKKIVLGIINEPIKLLLNTQIGQVEPLLRHREIQYRYLVYKNFKLIYAIDSQNEFINITDVFDARQNPKKLKRNK